MSFPYTDRTSTSLNRRTSHNPSIPKRRLLVTIHCPRGCTNNHLHHPVDASDASECYTAPPGL
jgi:hypothetical protein